MLGVVADRLGARALVDADGAELAVVLLDDVGADPADVVAHLVLCMNALGDRVVELVESEVGASVPEYYEMFETGRCVGISTRSSTRAA